ncbi:hypothetical protein COOONC_03273 [Cooperia oncophora]
MESKLMPRQIQPPADNLSPRGTKLTTGGRHYWESDHAWIGLKRKVLLFNKLNSRSRHVDDMDKWVWTDGTPVIYTNWDKKQPDNWHGEEACTHMFNHDTDPAAKTLE